MNAKASIAFLKEAAAYFSKQPADGEDSKHWANVLNSENCTHAAEVIASQASRIAEMEKALNEIEQLGSDGEHSGDRHARCRDIARNALGEAP